MKKIKLFFLLLVSVLILAGCQAPQLKEEGVDNEQQVIKGDIDTDICQAITADFVYSATGKPVVKVAPDWILPSQACRYYFTYDPNLNPQYNEAQLRGGGQLIFMMVENLSVENQKKGIEFLDGTYKSESLIKMENMATYREDGSLRDIRLIINPSRYVRIETNSGKLGISEAELIDFAVKVAEKIQGNLSFAIKKNPIELEEEKPVSEMPSQEQVVSDFLNKLASKDIAGALNMLDASESIKQSWGVNFNTIEKLEINKVEPVYPDEWTAERQVFKATLEVKVNSAGEQMGWQQGKSFRWLSLKKIGDQWKISEIASNP